MREWWSFFTSLRLVASQDECVTWCLEGFGLIFFLFLFAFYIPPFDHMLEVASFGNLKVGLFLRSICTSHGCWTFEQKEEHRVAIGRTEQLL